VIGHLQAPTDEVGLVRRPVLARLDDIETVLHGQIVDEVAICLPVSAWNFVEPVTQLCASEGKIVRIPAEGGPLIHGSYVEDVDGIKIASLVHGPDRALSLFVKRVVDITVASVALVIGSPLIIGVALYLRHSEGAPVVYRQTRIGLNGRAFEVLKFRTMVPDADKQLGQLKRLNEVRGRAFKITDDPRLTRTGSFLRRSSLDELPQLWNVLRGEMSLVGPRPPLPREVDGYDLWHRRRLSMKPGITGLWQVQGRRFEDFDRWVELDLAYIDRWSMWLDLKIMFRTIPAMFQGR
jgi:exopolysaccharide biosynthesis polyprenyl glycosylphosphotransferase